ncbi:MAG: hypothetical protein ABR576_06635 [Thermoanaerobaculia bacterium]
MITSAVLLLLVYASGGVLLAAVSRALGRSIPREELALFLLLPLVFAGPGLSPAVTPVPVDHAMEIPPWRFLPHPPVHNPALTDTATQFAPWAKAVRMAWKEGEIPHRDRWNGCGTPLAANGSSAAFSPITVLQFAFPLARGFLLAALLKLLLAMVGTWLWLREIGRSREAACFGAVLFSLSFAMTVWIYHPATAVICLWPWALFGIEALADARISRRAFLLLVAVLTLWPLSGHTESAAMGALFGALWLLGRLILRTLPRPRRVILGAAAASLAALGLSAFSLLPQWLAIQASNRLAIAEDPRHLEYVPWVPYRPGWLGGFVTTLFPQAYGDYIAAPMIPGAAGSITEMGFGYFGLVGAALALGFLRPGSRRPRDAWVLLALMIYGLGAAMGIPPFRFLTESLPGLGLAPPLRFLLFVSVAGSALAAFELDRLREDLRRTRGAGVLAAGIPLALVAAALAVFLHFRPAHAAAGGLPAQRAALGWALAILIAAASTLAAMVIARRERDRNALVLALTVLAAAELLQQGMRLYRFQPLTLLYPETPLIRFLHGQPRPFRVAGVQGALLPNSNVFAGLEDIRTHDPVERRDYVEFLDATAGYFPPDYFKVLRDFGSPALDFLNVRYLISEKTNEALPAKWNRVYAGADGAVFENSAVLPRIFAPARVQVVARDPRGARVTHALREFGSPLGDFLLRGLFADEAIALSTHEAFPTHGQSFSNGRLRMTGLTESSNRVAFRALVSEGATIAVTSYVQDAGWSARAGGRELPTGLANGPFLALLLPVGEYDVELRYSAPGFQTGAAVSIAAAAAGAGAWAYGWTRRRRRGVPAETGVG